MARRRMRWAIAGWLALVPARAGAVSPAAEALFQAGRRLMAEGKTAEACERFAETIALDPSSGEVLNLALCHETLGKTATAWTEYQEAARLSLKEGRADRASIATTKASALEPKLPRLTLLAASTVAGFQVASEAGPLAPSKLGVALPIDPGVHQIRATAPGYEAWSESIHIEPAEQRTLTVPPLARPPSPDRSATPPSLVASPSRPRPRSKLEIYTAAGGGILLVAGTVLYGVAYEKLSSDRSTCAAFPGCSTAEADSRQATVDTLQEAAIGSLLGGGALLLAAGLHHWFRATPWLTASIDPGHNTLMIGGTF